MNLKNFVLGLVLATATTAALAQPKTADEKLASLGERYRQELYASKPVWATLDGLHQYDDQWPDLSPEGQAKWQKALHRFDRQLKQINLNELSPESRVSAQVFAESLERDFAMYDSKSYLYDANHMNGLHVWLADTISYFPVETETDVHNFIARLNGLPRYLGGQIETWSLGLKQGYAAPRFSILISIEQVKTALNSLLARKSTFHTAIAKIKSPSKRWEALQALNFKVIPAYRNLLDFFEKRYLPKTRDSADGIWSQPHGDEIYKALIEYHTTLKFTADELNAIGEAEIARGNAEILKIAQRLGLSGSVSDVLNQIKSDPRNFFTSREEIFKAAQEKLQMAEAMIPQVITKIPPARYEVRAIHPTQEESAAEGYAGAPDLNFTRPGVFYINTYKPESRPRFGLASLAAHEAIPGHVLQFSVAAAAPSLPKFRTLLYTTAYTEGWAHYCEYLMYELGYYKTDLEILGMWADQNWRAARLVVDTGIHARHWTREQAVAYMLVNTGASELNVCAEVDRYFVWPGQALGYKVGQMEILKLRAWAHDQLGNKFNIREFHDLVLSNGDVPMPVLKQVIEGWVRSQRL
jgi:prolyl oligopeptidase